jgi:hypothetical protein
VLKPLLDVLAFERRGLIAQVAENKLTGHHLVLIVIMDKDAVAVTRLRSTLCSTGMFLIVMLYLYR